MSDEEAGKHQCSLGNVPHPSVSATFSDTIAMNSGPELDEIAKKDSPSHQLQFERPVKLIVEAMRRARHGLEGYVMIKALTYA